MRPRDLSANDPYVPGRGVEEVARDLGLNPDDLVKLSSNENPYGASPAAVETIHENAEAISVYPKAAHADLTEKLAAKWSVAPKQVWVGPGADGALDYLARAALDPGDRVLAPTPGFSYYLMSARYHHGTVATYQLSKENDFAQTADVVLGAYDGERMVYLTTPHNPTGAVFAHEEIAALADAVDEHTLLVVDEAYGEFSDEPSAVSLLDEFDNVAVTRTFSKAYGLAGLRIGYAVVPEAWADAYTRVNTPFAASELALRAAMAALDDRDHVERTVESARQARQLLYGELSARTWESGGNFVLAEVGDVSERGSEANADASGAASAVADRSQQEGVIVRDCSSFGLPTCIRVSCGTEDQMHRAVETLNDVITEVTTT